MSDIVERLRNTTFLQVSHPHFAPIAEAAHEAADEIESLRSRLAELESRQSTHHCVNCEESGRRLALAESYIEALEQNLNDFVDLKTMDEAIAWRAADSAPAEQPCGHPWKARHGVKCILCSSAGPAL